MDFNRIKNIADVERELDYKENEGRDSLKTVNELIGAVFGYSFILAAIVGMWRFIIWCILG